MQDANYAREDRFLGQKKKDNLLTSVREKPQKQIKHEAKGISIKYAAHTKSCRQERAQPEEVLFL